MVQLAKRLSLFTFQLHCLIVGSVPANQKDWKSTSLGWKCKVCSYFKTLVSGNGNGGTSVLSRPMQRKLVTLINCQLMEEEGRSRAMRAARSLGERTVTELILQHQNPQQLSANLWAAVRARGCQFLGPGTFNQGSVVCDRLHI